MAESFTIAIASGKGGTGKTTIATNIAYLAARMGQSVQYLDCDVEEPNGHIFLKPEIDTRLDVNASVPHVDLRKCTGCGRCADVCQYNAIVCLREANVLVFEQLCHSCGGCQRLCPAGAISCKPLNIGQIELGEAKGIGFISGRLNIGHIRTTLLINKVKEHIRDDCLTVLDVPPGTSCPVVEAVKRTDFVLLVTEPTAFGLNDLKLAVALVRKMDLPFAVLVNRWGVGNNDVVKYCQTEDIEIATKLPDDRRIAQVYSSGGILLEELPDYSDTFAALLSYLMNRLNTKTETRRK